MYQFELSLQQEWKTVYKDTGLTLSNFPVMLDWRKGEKACSHALQSIQQVN